ncbi:MAG TPA: hypothetical protein PLW68_14085 [Casimicrobiaceae bacterium]|nr:hypothetical protein [Casimicrobiaceae bacterium]
MPTESTHPMPAEQLRYARLLDLTSKIGFVALVAGYLAYVMGWLEEHVTVEQLPTLWNLPLAEYLIRTDSPTGWAWLAHLHKGEFAGLIGIAILAGCSIVCLAAIIPMYLRRGDRVYAGICAAEIAVLLLAASGVLGAGH